MYKRENGPYETADFYEFVGWSEKIKVFDDMHHGNDYTPEEVKEGLNLAIKNAEEYNKDEMERYGDYFGKYHLGVTEGIAVAGMEYANKYIMKTPAMMFIFSKYLGGVYVFKKVN